MAINMDDKLDKSIAGMVADQARAAKQRATTGIINAASNSVLARALRNKTPGQYSESAPVPATSGDAITAPPAAQEAPSALGAGEQPGPVITEGTAQQPNQSVPVGDAVPAPQTFERRLANKSGGVTFSTPVEAGYGPGQSPILAEAARKDAS